MRLLRLWHTLLALPRQTPLSWHLTRLHEELEEQRLATTAMERLSETSDVLFTISRAHHDGFTLSRALPPFASRYAIVYAYMVAKFTLRWGFYRVAAWWCGAALPVREVVNPAKLSKLEVVAERHEIDKEVFKRVGWWLKWVFPLLP